MTDQVLPDVLWGLIFDRLPYLVKKRVLFLVCRQWKDVCDSRLRKMDVGKYDLQMQELQTEQPAYGHSGYYGKHFFLCLFCDRFACEEIHKCDYCSKIISCCASFWCSNCEGGYCLLCGDRCPGCATNLNDTRGIVTIIPAKPRRSLQEIKSITRWIF